MDDFESLDHYKFLDEFAKKNWKDIKFRIVIKEAETRFFYERKNL